MTRMIYNGIRNTYNNIPTIQHGIDNRYHTFESCLSFTIYHTGIINTTPVVNNEPRNTNTNNVRNAINHQILKETVFINIHDMRIFFNHSFINRENIFQAILAIARLTYIDNGHFIHNFKLLFD